MSSNGMRVVVGIAVVAVAVVLLIVLSNSGDDGSGEATTGAPAGSTSTDGAQSSEGGTSGGSGAQAAVPTVVVKGGKPVGGVRNLTYIEGDQIRFRVESDVADEVHVHGYDISKDVEAGGSVNFDFTADIEGVFEAELEEHREQILEITVNP